MRHHEILLISGLLITKHSAVYAPNLTWILDGLNRSLDLKSGHLDL